MRKVCVQDIENVSSCSFCVYPVLPIRLGKVIKYEAKKTMPIIYLETLNIEKGQIDPKHNRRVKTHTCLWSFRPVRGHLDPYMAVCVCVCLCVCVCVCVCVCRASVGERPP